ncbi:uncharacterized protein LAESUDRAFT_653395, partial [Laetiporus sulphureus 93-53]
LVNEHTTLQRHLQSAHEGENHAWCNNNDFISMLPKDTKHHHDEANVLEQTCLDPHLEKRPRKEYIVLYSDALFHEASIEWIIATDQLIQALEHASFKKMIDVAACTINGVEIPNCKQSHHQVIDMFHQQMMKLRERLTVHFRLTYCGPLESST